MGTRVVKNSGCNLSLTILITYPLTLLLLYLLHYSWNWNCCGRVMIEEGLFAIYSVITGSRHSEEGDPIAKTTSDAARSGECMYFKDISINLYQSSFDLGAWVPDQKPKFSWHILEPNPPPKAYWLLYNVLYMGPQREVYISTEREVDSENRRFVRWGVP